MEMNKKGQIGELPVGWMVAIIGLVVAVLAGLFGKDKNIRTKTQWIFGMIAVASVLLMFAGVAFLDQPTGNFLGGTGSTLDIGGESDGAIVSSGICPPGKQVEDTTVTLAAKDKFTSGASGGRHTYRVGDNGVIKDIADAGSFTASPGDKLQILWGNGSYTTGNYFSQYQELNVPCQGTYEPVAELVQNGTLTFEVFNEEGNLIDTTGENETLANGDVVTLTSNLKGTFQRGFPLGGVMVVEYDPTYYDKITVDFGDTVTATTPSYYSRSNTNNATVAYNIPAILGTNALGGTITIDVNDNNNPAQSGGSQDVFLTFVPKNYFIDEDNGGSFNNIGVQDEDLARAFPHSTAFRLNVD